MFCYLHLNRVGRMVGGCTSLISDGGVILGIEEINPSFQPDGNTEFAKQLFIIWVKIGTRCGHKKCSNVICIP